jgi:hypothetical protein
MDINMSIIRRLTQEVIEDRYSRKNIHKHIRKDLMECAEMVDKFDAIELAIHKHIHTTFDYKSKNERMAHLRNTDIDWTEVLTELMITVVRTGEAQNIQSIVGCIGHMFKHDDPFDGIRTAGEIVAIAGEHDLFNVIPAKYSDTVYMMIEPIYELSEEVKQYIADTKYLPPMITKPLKVTKNFDYDYYTVESSKILGSGNHHDMPLALDVINIANGIAMELDLDVLAEEEKSSKPLDTPEKIKNFNRMTHASRIVYNEILEHGNRFYNTHKYDKRGRLYSQGYHVHIQSTEYKKALINLAHKEIIEL